MREDRGKEMDHEGRALFDSRSHTMETRKGCRFRSKRPIAVTCMTSWAAPFTGGYKRTLPANETIVVASDPPASATVVYCDPERYRALHALMVPWRDRMQFWVYRGYYLCVALETLRTDCERL